MKKLLVLQHILREHPSNIAEYAHDRGVTLDVIGLWKSEPIPDVALYDGLIVLGGPMGVYEEYTGKHEELSAIQKHIGTVPMLGICLGAQLLAHALGAKVYRHTVDGKHIKEVGYYTVEHTEEGKSSALFKDLPEQMKVLQWHGDTFDIPDGAIHTAVAPTCKNQAFSIGNTHGLQFHVEATPEMIGVWVERDSEWTHTDFDLDEARILREAEETAPLMKEQCYKILDNFLSVQ